MVWGHNKENKEHAANIGKKPHIYPRYKAVTRTDKRLSQPLQRKEIELL